MKEIYQKINGDDYRNVWIVGDLHGCYTNLMNRLDAVGFDPAQDLLVSVGDLIDREPRTSSAWSCLLCRGSGLYVATTSR